MRCMSCKAVEMSAANTKIFGRILLCTQCNALAEKAMAEIKQRIAMAEQHAMNWLEQYVLGGGLLQGGDGNGLQTARRPSLPVPGLPEVQDPEKDRGSGLPLADRKHSPR